MHGARASKAVLLIASLGCALTLTAASPDDGSGLMVMYSFDAMSGSVLRDLSGNGHDGTISGATWVDGKFGGGLQFDGVDDFAQAVGYYQFSSSNAVTFEAWVKLAAQPGFATILAFRHCCDYRLLISPARHPFYDPGTYTDIEADRFTFGLDTWHHYALVVVGGHLASAFLDGELIRSDAKGVPAQLPDTYDALSIGGAAEGTGVFTAGVIDEVRIYNKALTQDQIKRDLSTASTDVLLAEADAALTALELRGASTTALKGAMRDARLALRRQDRVAAQELASRALSVARTAPRSAGSSTATAVDYGRVLFAVLVLLSLGGAATAAALIWSAWRGERDTA